MRHTLLVPLFAALATLATSAGCGSSDDGGASGGGSPTGAGGSVGGSGGSGAGTGGATALGGGSGVGGSSSQGPGGAGGQGPGGGGAASGGKGGGSGGQSGAAGQGGASAGASGAAGSAGSAGMTGGNNPTFAQLFEACVAFESSSNNALPVCTGCISSMCASLLQFQMECQSPHDSCQTTCGSGANKSCLCTCVLNLASACKGAYIEYYWCIHNSCPQQCD